MELKTGMKRLSSSFHVADTTMCFLDDELNSLIRYMDPSADGDLTIVEVKDAFRRALDHDADSERFQYGVDTVLRKLDDLMKKKGATVCAYE